MVGRVGLDGKGRPKGAVAGRFRFYTEERVSENVETETSIHAAVSPHHKMNVAVALVCQPNEVPPDAVAIRRCENPT